MNSMNCAAGPAFASASTAHDCTSPNWAGSRPSGPVSAVTMPVLSTRNRGSAAHCGQLGAASSRSPASSSRMNDDQIVIAALPAK